MSTDLENIQLIESYLEGTLSGEQLSKFESSLKENDILREEVEYQKLVAASIIVSGKNELKSELNEIHENLFGGGAELSVGKSIGATPATTQKLWMYVSIPAIIIGSFMYFFSSADEEKAPVKQEEKQEEKHIVSLKDKAKKSTTLTPDGHNNSNALTKESKNKEVTDKKTAAVNEKKTTAKDIEAGEIIVDNTDFGSVDVMIDPNGKRGVYQFDGKVLTLFGDYGDNEYIEVKYYINDDHFYMLEENKVYRLEVTNTNKDLIEETNSEILRDLEL